MHRGGIATPERQPHPDRIRDLEMTPRPAIKSLARTGLTHPTAHRALRHPKRLSHQRGILRLEPARLTQRSQPPHRDVTINKAHDLETYPARPIARRDRTGAGQLRDESVANQMTNSWTTR
jgi:hypothetical protein